MTPPSRRAVYTAVLEFKYTYGPVGYVGHSREDALDFLHRHADAALLHLDDWVNNTEWFTAAGDEQ